MTIDPATVADAAKRLSPGARRSLMAMTDELRFPGFQTFSGNSAQSFAKRGIAEWTMAANAKAHRMKRAYRLTPLGMAVKAHIQAQGPADVAKRLSSGARRALMAMTDRWQFAGQETFNGNSAYGLYRRLRLADMALLPKGDTSKHLFRAYRLNQLGMAVKAHLGAQGQ